ncbi:hypothetical protein SanaruYs_20600 [Chryseotalea sanaruensis]|uniref:DUF6438 domain-containing protein n=1 Tax=Chryseotalea sanaruensis TaxID=2482724 RepID=A0A401UAC4_9BACT|nr:hypothetical protein [Chryseotalea sanaruensis]GCC51831.1 hypothetical protein SanaruYs_20600 [Chryseotalea sanaruensis]
MRVPIVKSSLQIIISLFTIGCTQLPKQIPEDFQVLIENSPIQPGGGGNYSLMIRQTASKGQFELIRNYDNTIRKLTLSTYGVQRLYDAVRDAKIFRLKDNYADMNVLDGSNITLTIKVNGKVKVINMRNKQPDELKSVSSILRKFELEIR